VQTESPPVLSRLRRLINRVQALGVACVVIVFVACASIEDPSIFAGAEVFTPPAKYHLWWQVVQSCSGKQADISSVEWLVVPGARALSDGSSGAWIGATRQIVLAEQAMNSPALVRHEMLHAMLTEHGHPASQFLVACDGFVSCDVVCEADAGGRSTVANDAPLIPSTDLLTQVEVFPLAPSTSEFGGAYVVSVSVTNPAESDVWVQLERAPVESAATTFAVIYDSGNPDLPQRARAISTLETRFAMRNGERRRHVWDEIGQAGLLGVRGVFNRDTSARVSTIVK
jgi:hypothetical protein